MPNSSVHIAFLNNNSPLLSFGYAALLFASLTSKFAGSGNKDFIN